MMQMLALFVFCLATCGMSQEWANDYDGYLYFECPEGQAINHMMSIHDNGPEDRIWAFECAALEHGYEACAWSGYVNNYDEVKMVNDRRGQTNNIRCSCSSARPERGWSAAWRASTTITPRTGGESGHFDIPGGNLEMFRWNYKCCSAPNTCYHDCHYSPYINDYDEPMDYTVQDG